MALKVSKFIALFYLSHPRGERKVAQSTEPLKRRTFQPLAFITKRLPTHTLKKRLWLQGALYAFIAEP